MIRTLFFSFFFFFGTYRESKWAVASPACYRNHLFQGYVTEPRQSGRGKELGSFGGSDERLFIIRLCTTKRLFFFFVFFVFAELIWLYFANTTSLHLSLPSSLIPQTMMGHCRVRFPNLATSAIYIPQAHHICGVTLYISIYFSFEDYPSCKYNCLDLFYFFSLSSTKCFFFFFWWYIAGKKKKKEKK